MSNERCPWDGMSFEVIGTPSLNVGLTKELIVFGPSANTFEVSWIENYTQVQSILFDQVQLRGNVWAMLSRLVTLKELSIQRADVPELSPSNARRFESLQSLDVRMTNIRDKTLNAIAEMTALRSLILLGTKISDDGVVPIGELSGLQVLSLNGTRVTNRCIDTICMMRNLKLLSLEATIVSDVGIELLTNCVGLEKLEIQGTQATESCIPALSSLPELKVLYVDFPLSESGILSFTEFQQLQELYVGAETSDEMRELATQSLPNVEIY
jgi:hypothetical protein